MSVLQQYIHSSRYARWLPENGRRETWDETVQYVDGVTGCCYCWHGDLDSEANSTLNRGYFWKNENGTLVKTYFKYL